MFPICSLAYNLVRSLMAKAAEKAGIEPREISFAGAVQTVNAFAPVLAMTDQVDRPGLLDILLRTIARHRVGVNAAPSPSVTAKEAGAAIVCGLFTDVPAE